MRLFIGGFAQGKTEYVKGLFQAAQIYDESTVQKLYMSADELRVDGQVILNHLHLCIRGMLLEGKKQEDVEETIAAIIENYPDILIICDEIGNGVVPVDGFEREYREITGRILIDIAKKSESVERIICQLPMKLK